VNIYGTCNHDLLRDMINEVGRSKKHFILMGDFNYRYMHWPPLSNHQRVTKEAVDFYHCLEDNFSSTCRILYKGRCYIGLDNF